MHLESSAPADIKARESFCGLGVLFDAEGGPLGLMGFPPLPGVLKFTFCGVTGVCFIGDAMFRIVGQSRWI